MDLSLFSLRELKLSLLKGEEWDQISWDDVPDIRERWPREEIILSGSLESIKILEKNFGVKKIGGEYGILEDFAKYIQSLEGREEGKGLQERLGMWLRERFPKWIEICEDCGGKYTCLSYYNRNKVIPELGTRTTGVYWKHCKDFTDNTLFLSIWEVGSWGDVFIPVYRWACLGVSEEASIFF